MSYTLLRDLYNEKTKFTDDELQAIQFSLGALVVQCLAGQLGIMRGANRFISLCIALKKSDPAFLNSAYRKWGLGNGLKIVNDLSDQITITACGAAAQSVPAAGVRGFVHTL